MLKEWEGMCNRLLTAENKNKVLVSALEACTAIMYDALLMTEETEDEMDDALEDFCAMDFSMLRNYDEALMTLGAWQDEFARLRK